MDGFRTEDRFEGKHLRRECSERKRRRESNGLDVLEALAAERLRLGLTIARKADYRSGHFLKASFDALGYSSLEPFCDEVRAFLTDRVTGRGVKSQEDELKDRFHRTSAIQTCSSQQTLGLGYYPLEKHVNV
jgi:hypothetical protein